MPAIIITTPISPGLPPSAPTGAITVSQGQVMIYNGTMWIPLGTAQEDAMVDFDVKYKAVNVNSKRLLQRLVDVVTETVPEFVFMRSSTLNRTYDFSQLTAYLDAYMDELCEDKLVNKFDIIGDFRNNKAEAVRKGNIEIEVSFQQFNCLNITKVTFFLTKI